MRNMYETPVRVFRNGVVKTVPAGEVQENDVVSVLGRLHVVTAVMEDCDENCLLICSGIDAWPAEMCG